MKYKYTLFINSKPNKRIYLCAWCKQFLLIFHKTQQVCFILLISEMLLSKCEGYVRRFTNGTQPQNNGKRAHRRLMQLACDWTLFVQILIVWWRLMVTKTVFMFAIFERCLAQLAISHRHQTLYFELSQRLWGRHTEIQLAGWSGRTKAAAKQCLNCTEIFRFIFNQKAGTLKVLSIVLLQFID